MSFIYLRDVSCTNVRWGLEIFVLFEKFFPPTRSEKATTGKSCLVFAVADSSSRVKNENISEICHSRHSFVFVINENIHLNQNMRNVPGVRVSWTKSAICDSVRLVLIRRKEKCKELIKRRTFLLHFPATDLWRLPRQKKKSPENLEIL